MREKSPIFPEKRRKPNYPKEKKSKLAGKRKTLSSLIKMEIQKRTRIKLRM